MRFKLFLIEIVEKGHAIGDGVSVIEEKETETLCFPSKWKITPWSVCLLWCRIVCKSQCFEIAVTVTDHR